MKKLTLCVLWIIIVSLNQVTIAQSQQDNVRMAWKALELYQSLNTVQSSEKTTSTVKKIQATSEFNNVGDLEDSLLVLIPSVGGTSILSSNYFVAYDPFGIPALPIFQMDPHRESYVDFAKAIYFSYDYQNPDTIYRNKGTSGLLESESITTFDATFGGYYSAKSSFIYDAQGRVTAIYRYNEFGGIQIDTMELLFDYGPNGEYITIQNISYGTTDYVDSMVISNNQLQAVYIFDNGSIIKKINYAYNLDNQLTGIKQWDGNQLVYDYSQIPRPGSDYPNSFQHINISGLDTTINACVFNYNSSTGFIETGTRLYSGSQGTLTLNMEFHTDSDGDITKIEYKTVSGALVVTRNYYYEANPSGIDNYALFKSDIQTYPVPSSHEVNVISSENFDGYRLYDQSGRLLETKNFNKTQNQKIDVNRLSSGLYFLEVLSLNKGQTVVIEKR